MIRKAGLQVGFPVLLFCISLNAYLAVAHLRQMQQMAAVTVNISKTQATISEVVKDLIDMETGQRGYLLTGDQSYLQPYTAAIDRIGPDFANLRSELPSRPGGQQALESRLESLARSKQSEMDRTIDLRQKRYRHRSFMLVDTNEGKAYMDEARQIVSSLASTESSALVRFDLEKNLALRKMLSEIIMVNVGVLVLAAFLFRLVRYDGRVKAEEAARSRQELASRDAQLAKLTSALSGQARSGFTALNANSRLLLENYGGFLPRQGHECAEHMKEVATEMERLRQDLVGDQIPGCEPTAA